MDIRKRIRNDYEQNRGDFKKMTAGMEVVKNAILELDKFKSSRHRGSIINKDTIMRALEERDAKFLRNLSVYFYSVSGIYSRLCSYLAGLLTYDWYLYPYLLDSDFDKENAKIKTREALSFFDKSHIKTKAYDIALDVVVKGSYYGYFIVGPGKKKGAFLDLPPEYCRSRYYVNNLRAVEFNVKYFSDQFKDEETREMILDLFPKEFRKAFNDFLNGKLEVDKSDRGAWFLCDPRYATKFCLMSEDIPIFSSVVPAILTLDEAKELDMKKTMQELLKVIIQKMPLDKNGEMIFDIDEAQDMHNNACRMLTNAINVDVLTTFADIDVADLDSSSATTNRDPLSKIERGVFNEAGISQMLFDTNGNLALEKSVANDEALMFYLLQQMEAFFNQVVGTLFNKEQVEFKISMPRFSIYNLEKKVKTYKELANQGYSKLLPAIAAGVSQSEFMSLNTFENEILDLNEKMVPVQLSSTQSGGGSGEVGAPEKEPDEVTEKTIQNKESQS